VRKRNSYFSEILYKTQKYNKLKNTYNILIFKNVVLILRRLRWAGHVARMGERRGAYRV
jgi:hypothetical protein